MIKFEKIHQIALGSVVVALFLVSCGGAKRTPTGDLQQGAENLPYGAGNPGETKPGQKTGGNGSAPINAGNPLAPGSSLIPSPAPSPSPSPVSEVPEFNFLSASGPTGDVSLIPVWPADRNAWKGVEEQIAGAPRRVKQEIHYDKVIQLPGAGVPQLFLVLREQLEGVPILSGEYESFAYDISGTRLANSGKKRMNFTLDRKQNAFYIPLAKVISELKDRAESADYNERIEIIFNFELQNKGTRQWALNFTAHSPLPPILVQHFALNKEPADLFQTGSIQLFETHAYNDLRRNLVLWGAVQTGKIGSVITVGQIDRYPDDLTTRWPRIVRTDTLKAESSIELDSVEILSIPLNGPRVVTTLGKFPVNDSKFTQVMPQNTLIVMRWWGRMSLQGCPNPTLKKTFRWPEGGRTPGFETKEVTELYRASGKRVSAHMNMLLRVTDSHWSQERAVFHAKPEQYPNLREIMNVVMDFQTMDLPGNVSIPTQASCNGVFLN